MFHLGLDPDEPFRVPALCLAHRRRPGCRHFPVPFRVGHRRREQVDPLVVMLVVVPGHKGPDEPPGLLEAAEPVREFRAVFQGLELAFRVRVVGEDRGPAVGLLEPQLPKQLADLLLHHRAAPVAVNCQAAPLNAHPGRVRGPAEGVGAACGEPGILRA
jgi:hypothetical protein